MTFTIPRPDWVSDSLIEERGQYAGFQMYTTEGNDAVAKMVQFVVSQSEENRLRRPEMIEVLKEGVRLVAKTHPEIHDTEPEWAIVDAINTYCDEAEFRHIDRDHL
jgi:hypothetical protein